MRERSQKSTELIKYTWKCGIQLSSRTEFTATKPLSVDMLIVDLLDGSQFQVLAIHPAKPMDREFAALPETVVHTWPRGRMSEDGLEKLRARARYTPQEDSYPLKDVVFDF